MDWVSGSEGPIYTAAPFAPISSQMPVDIKSEGWAELLFLSDGLGVLRAKSGITIVPTLGPQPHSALPLTILHPYTHPPGSPPSPNFVVAIHSSSSRIYHIHIHHMSADLAVHSDRDRTLESATFLFNILATMTYRTMSFMLRRHLYSTL